MESSKSVFIRKSSSFVLSKLRFITNFIKNIEILVGVTYDMSTSLPLIKYILYLPLNTVAWNVECNYTIVALHLYKEETTEKHRSPTCYSNVTYTYLYCRYIYMLSHESFSALWIYIQWIQFYNLSMMTIRWWWATLKRGVHVLWRSTTTQHIETHTTRVLFYLLGVYVCVYVLIYIVADNNILIHSQSRRDVCIQCFMLMFMFMCAIRRSG